MNDKELIKLINIEVYEEIIRNLKQENEQLKKQKEELKEWIKKDKEYAMENFECGRCFNMFDLLNKINELEGSEKN